MSGQHPNTIKVLAGNSHTELALQIATKLNCPLSPMLLVRLANGECTLTVGESVRDQDVFILQTGSSHTGGGLNDHIVELCILINACRAASARRITAVIPCYPYARQDKKDKSRAPITAKLVANLISAAGADHVITMDLHASQIQGFFDVPADNLCAEPILLHYIVSKIPNYQRAILVSPDAGGVKRCAAMADRLDLDFAIIHKERRRANEVSRMVLVGDVKDRVAIIVDDMADTCGTLVLAAETLRENGAKLVYAMVIHPILSGEAVAKIEASSLHQLIVTNTVPLGEAAASCEKIVNLDISGTLAEAIRRIHNGESVSYLFNHAPGE
jgi:ribose-phosphate pyrophosphokinase